jgi:hypothetical protein
MPPVDENELIRTTLQRIESKLDKMQTEYHTRFSSIELRLASLEGTNSNRKEGMNRAWAGVFAFTLPTVGCFVWLFTTLYQTINRVDTIDLFGSKAARDQQKEFDDRLKAIEVKHK